jgi:hypothetical protein
MALQALIAGAACQELTDCLNGAAAEAALSPGSTASGCHAEAGDDSRRHVVGSQEELRSQLRAGVGRLQQASRPALHEMAGEGAGSNTAQQLEEWQQALQPAAEVATALQRFWPLPEQVAAARLEAAHAAAARSCAFLGCCNLGL